MTKPIQVSIMLPILLQAKTPIHVSNSIGVSLQADNKTADKGTMILSVSFDVFLKLYSKAISFSIHYSVTHMF